METVRKRRRVVVDDSALAHAIGDRIKRARLASGLTQSALAGDRYTKAYISALEHGLAKPSMAALNYLAPRLGTTSSALIADSSPVWDRLSADLRMAAGDLVAALDGYQAILVDAGDRVGRAEILLAQAQCLCRLDRPREAIRPASEAADVFASAGRASDAAQADYWLASAHYQMENEVEARAILTRLIEVVRSPIALDPDFRIRVLIATAMLERSSGSPGKALAYLEEARGLSVELDDRRRGTFLATLADAYRDAGDIEAAIRYGLQALALLRAAEVTVDLGHLENQLALAYMSAGSLARAADLAHSARAAALDRGDLALAAHLAQTEAEIAFTGGDADAAVALADEAIEAATTAASEKARLAALVTRARANASLGRHEQAAADFEAAAGQAPAGSPSRREILSAWADSLAALGQHDRAFALAREALEQR
jgi:tetratricopeptide (TPR) repeat protein